MMNFFSIKSLVVLKKAGRGAGGPLASPGIVCYAEKKEQLFWLTSSLGQMVQFDTLKYLRTFKNYFGLFEWSEKNPLV